MTDLQTELAALISSATYEARLVAESLRPAFLAERLAAAFQQVAWRNDVGSFIDCEWAERRGLAAMYDGPCPDWAPVYRFVRPESEEPKESNE